ncbi:molybdopterin-dependent oxidoreductase [Natronorubrum aibiense]|uniref:Molybdopterin-dependent oxidoreductase n=1 Tax=Natronorubrum aibiense TaxID=348826 RepID=A0A5P9PA58_9EURY|nr:molybdopterin-dependent oxidoreductase [Natronorubrum aibiense]QFU84750.1 molybdopterin-dependent oxidoreductase [Natronorubrum aibiense]
MDDLKQHDIPADVNTNEWALRVTGAVEQPLRLTRRDLTSLSLEEFTGEFACAEGWVADELSWRGVRVGTILDHASPTPEGDFALVRAMDGDYACSFPRERLAESILALELDGDALSPEHGGPVRLVPTATDRNCWESIKWVAEIELTESRPTAADTAKELALSRIE